MISLTESDARDQLRLDAHDHQIDELRVTTNRLSGKVEDCRIDAAQAKSACDDWVRKLRRGAKQGD